MDEQFTPDENDAFITDNSSGYSVSFDGRARGWIQGMDEAVKLLVHEFNSSQYWPNVWYVNDHGNVTLLSVNSDTGEWDFTETAYV